jgi:transposase-like protein
MAIESHNSFKGRQFRGEVIILCVRWYLRYPLSYEHVSELVAEQGVEVDASCIWRWVQAYCACRKWRLQGIRSSEHVTVTR